MRLEEIMDIDDAYEAAYQAELELQQMLEEALQRVQRNEATKEDVSLVRYACGLGGQK
jgi:hypothetical protein